jgi:hypothetical protein
MRRPFFAGDPNVLADFNFSTPLVQSFPTTAAGLATKLGNPSAVASYIWDCQEASGNLVDTIAGVNQVPISSPMQGRTAVGIDGGTGYLGRGAVETIYAPNEFQIADSNILKAGLTSIGYLYVFRSPRTTPSASAMVGKGSSASIHKGHKLEMSGATGYLSCRIGDGTNTVAVANTSNAADGAWHAVMLVIDRTAGFVYLYCDQQAVVSADISIIGDIGTTDPFGIGVGRFQTIPQQATYLAMFEGAAAELLNQASLDSFWSHAKDPTGLLTTTSRASTISVEVAPGKVAHFAGGTTLGTCQLPIGYHAALSDEDKLALYCNNVVTNLIPYSRLSTGATGATTNTDIAIDAADGFRAASRHQANSADDFVGKVCAVAESTAYCGSVYLKQYTAGVSGRVYAYDATNLAEIAGAVAFVASADWEDTQVPFTTPVGCTSVELRVEITTNGELVASDFWQVNLGSARGATINTSGAAAALVGGNYKATAAAGVLVKSTIGESESIFVASFEFNGTNPYVYDAFGSGNADRMLHYLPSNNRLPAQLHFDSASAAQVNHGVGVQDTDGQENVTVCKWDAAGGMAGGVDGSISYNGEAPVEDVGSYTVADTITDIKIGGLGTSVGANFQFHGFIQRVRIWDGLRA